MTPSNLTALIERLEQLEREATPGKWEVGYSESDGYRLGPSHCWLADVYGDDDEANTLLIAEMKSALPRLLRLLKIQREALEFYNRCDMEVAIDNLEDSIKKWKPGRSIANDPSKVARQALAECERVAGET